MSETCVGERIPQPLGHTCFETVASAAQSYRGREMRNYDGLPLLGHLFSWEMKRKEPHAHGEICIEQKFYLVDLREGERSESWLKCTDYHCYHGDLLDIFE